MGAHFEPLAKRILRLALVVLPIGCGNGANAPPPPVESPAGGPSIQAFHPSVLPADRTPVDSLLPCTPLDPRPPQPEQDVTEDVRGRHRWSCHIATQLPPVEVVLVGDTNNVIVQMEIA